MRIVITVLSKDLEWEVRQQIFRRYDSLVNQYEYMKENRNKDLMFTFGHDWFDDKYTTLFALNAFFQVVLGPLASASRGISQVGLGSRIPIIYGDKIRFDSQRNRAVNNVYGHFIKLADEFGFSEWLLTSNRTSDVVYSVAKTIRENE